jgi:AraC-like DNA-binding protein
MGPLPRLLEQARGLRAVERVFRAEGLPLWLAHDQSSNLPVRCLTGLIERAAREIGDDLFGVNLGHAMQPEDFGPVIQYMASATNIGDLLRRSVRALRYHTSGAEFNFVLLEDHARWEIRTIERIVSGRRHYTDHVLYPMLTALRRYLGPKWSPLRIELDYDRPFCWRATEHRFQVPVVYGCATNAVVFEKRFLKAPAMRQLAIANTLSWQDLRRLVMQRPPRTSVEATREVVRLRLLESSVDIDGAARLLGVGARTLQRQLAEDNFTYRDLVQQVRMGRAVDLLNETSESITSIAYSLGYSDVASFTRVFRQWTGFPPSHFRRPSFPPHRA